MLALSVLAQFDFDRSVVMQLDTCRVAMDGRCLWHARVQATFAAAHLEVEHGMKAVTHKAVLHAV